MNGYSPQTYEFLFASPYVHVWAKHSSTGSLEASCTGRSENIVIKTSQWMCIQKRLEKTEEKRKCWPFLAPSEQPHLKNRLSEDDSIVFQCVGVSPQTTLQMNSFWWSKRHKSLPWRFTYGKGVNPPCLSCEMRLVMHGNLFHSYD